jgi:hypothetical protein
MARSRWPEALHDLCGRRRGGDGSAVLSNAKDIAITKNRPFRVVDGIHMSSPAVPSAAAAYGLAYRGFPTPFIIEITSVHGAAELTIWRYEA